jgi:hypothetical protein
MPEEEPTPGCREVNERQVPDAGLGSERERDRTAGGESEEAVVATLASIEREGGACSAREG